MLRCNNKDLSPSFPELLVIESGMSGRLIVYGLQGGKSRRGNRNILTYITLKINFSRGSLCKIHKAVIVICCLLEAVLLIDAVPDLPRLWSSVAREALWVQQQVDILGVW